MANRYAVASGNWSNAATWDGGTLPGVGDDVYANNNTVTIDQNVTVLSLRRSTAVGIAQGGRFGVTSGDRVVNANVYSEGPTGNAAFNILYMSAGSLTVNGSVESVDGAPAIHLTGGTALTINGDVLGSGTAGGTVGPAILDNGATNIQVTLDGGTLSRRAGNSHIFRLGSTGVKLRIGSTFSLADLWDNRLLDVYSARPTILFMRSSLELGVTAPSDDDWPNETGAPITLGQGGTPARYTLAVGDSAVSLP